MVRPGRGIERNRAGDTAVTESDAIEILTAEGIAVRAVRHDGEIVAVGRARGVPGEGVNQSGAGYLHHRLGADHRLPARQLDDRDDRGGGDGGSRAVAVRQGQKEVIGIAGIDQRE
jgi:hypothetical protein